jgi:tetrapyrrole methylase family protein/MazG family protein
MDLTIVGLGPGEGSLLTLEARQVLEEADEIYLRTRQHPAVSSLPGQLTMHSFDHLYESEEEFSAVYEEIAKQVVELARRPQGVVYAVPGHPLVGEESVRRILGSAREQEIEVRIVVGLSFIEAALVPLDIDPLDGLQIADATILATRLHPNLDPDLPALVGQLYSRRVAAELKLTLMNLYPAAHTVILLRRVGTLEARKESLPLHELDHIKDIDHLTSLYVPPLPEPSSLSTFHDIVARLRAPRGCPWDREQTHQTLRPHLLEETYEVLEALDEDDSAALREELGDLLLQIVLHTQIAVEEGEFTLAQVLETIIAKIVRRHPHVFGDLQVADAEEVLRNWQTIKHKEKPDEERLLWGTPLSLPALALAQRAQQRANQAGFRGSTREELLSAIGNRLNTVTEANDPEQVDHEFGRLLFDLVSLARLLGVDAESALRSATREFGTALPTDEPPDQDSDDSDSQG